MKGVCQQEMGVVIGKGWGMRWQFVTQLLVSTMLLEVGGVMRQEAPGHVHLEV